MLSSIALLVLVGQGLAAALPHDSFSETRSTQAAATDTAIFRSFTLPPLPGPSDPIIIIDTQQKAKTTTTTSSAKKTSTTPSPTSSIGNGQTYSATPAPTEVQITGLTYGGTGCPANSIGSAISPDLTVITLIMSDYVASIGPGIVLTESRKNCQINLALEYPGGFQYSIMSADYRGYADLEAGISGTQQSTYYFSGQVAQASTGTTWKGPYIADYELVDEANDTSIVWSPCGQSAMLNINSQLALTSSNSSASGFLTTDSIDTSFVQKVYIAWQPCTA